MEEDYPTVTTTFIFDKILESGKIIPESRMDIGNTTTTFVREGDKPLHKRFISVRHKKGLVQFMQATALAITFGFMGELLEWYKENRKWKEGGYVVERKDNQ